MARQKGSFLACGGGGGQSGGCFFVALKIGSGYLGSPFASEFCFFLVCRPAEESVCFLTKNMRALPRTA